MMELFEINFLSGFSGIVLTDIEEMGCWKVAQSLIYYQPKFDLEIVKNSRMLHGCCLLIVNPQMWRSVFK